VRRSAKILTALGTLIIVLAIVAIWVVPALAVKYPGGPLNKTAHAEGTFTLFIDPATAGALPTPQQRKLVINRNLNVVETSGSRAVVQENDEQEINGLKGEDLRQRYILDRKSLKDVSDDRSWAYSEDNKVDRSPAYAVNLPFDAGDGPYQVWKNETGSSYAFRKTGEVTKAGVKLYRYRGTMTNEKAQDYYIKQLASQGVPEFLTPAQAAAQLKSLGADPTLLATAVLPTLAAADREAAQSILAQNVPLTYTIDVDTTFLVEPKTGAIVGLDRILQTLKASPDIQGIGRIQTILSKPQYANNAVVKSAAGIIEKLVKNPPTSKIFTLDYAQTPASVDDLAKFAQSRADKIMLAKVWIPVILGVVGVVLLILGLVLGLRGRRRAAATTATE
jgi:hypothetical protein